MNRLLIFLSLLLIVNAGVVRLPKIYNALISSDANLTPSQAYPILEPVYRTTALGVAFPPLFVHPSAISKQAIKSEEKEKEKDEDDDNKETATETTELSEENQEVKKSEPSLLFPELAYHGNLYPLAVDPYFPYGYPPEFFYPPVPYYQHYQHPVFAEYNQFNPIKKEKNQQPKPVPTNHKKSEDIPDVPPPPLPIKEEKKNETLE